MRNRIPTPARFLLVLLMAVIGSLAFAASPAAADGEFDADGVIECVPTTDPDGAEYYFLSNETNPNGFEVTYRSHTDGPVENVGFTYVVRYVDNAGNPGEVTAEIAPANDCTPAPPLTLSVSATIECAVVDGAAQFTIWVNINNPDGLEIVSQTHTNGQVVDNVDVTVTVVYTNDRWKQKEATAHASATDDCTPDERHTMSIAAHLECTVDKGTEVFTLVVTENNPNGLTITDRSHTNGQEVSNEAFTVTYTYTDNRGDSQTATAEVSAINGCLPDDSTMSINAHLVCSVDKDVEVFTLSITENNPDGLTITDRSHTNGQEVSNEDFTVTYTYVDGNGDEQTATADVSAIPSCKVPDGDWAEDLAKGGWGLMLLVSFAGVLGLLIGGDTLRRRRATVFNGPIGPRG